VIAARKRSRYPHGHRTTLTKTLILSIIDEYR